MSRLLVPRPPSADLEINSSQSSQKAKKISTACAACKQRKTKCSGTAPCDACGTRGSACIYDITADQRRKAANQRNIQDLSETQNNLERHKQLLGGIIAIFRAGDFETTEDLVATIRSGVDLSQLAAHVRNARRANTAINSSFDDIEFVINGPKELPSPGQLLNTIVPSQGSSASMNSRLSAGGLPSAGSRYMPSLGSFSEPKPDAWKA